MNTLFYNGENGLVDPVFYPVVPDAFMTRVSDAAIGPRPAPEWFLLADADAPLLAPSDPWSF